MKSAVPTDEIAAASASSTVSVFGLAK